MRLFPCRPALKSLRRHRPTTNNSLQAIDQTCRYPKISDKPLLCQYIDSAPSHDSLEQYFCDIASALPSLPSK